MNRYNPTEDMIRVTEMSENIARAQMQNLISLAHDAWLAGHLDNAVGANGKPTLVGAFTAIDKVQENLMAAFFALSSLTDREYADLLKYRFKMAALGHGPRFHTEEQWDQLAPHLKEDLARLEEKFKDV